MLFIITIMSLQILHSLHLIFRPGGMRYCVSKLLWFTFHWHKYLKLKSDTKVETEVDTTLDDGEIEQPDDTDWTISQRFENFLNYRLF